jgi:hypothetical protein
MKMKIICIVILGIGLIILFQSNIIMSTNKTEEQKYTLVKTYDDFEIRFYPPATIATISSSAKTYKELASPGFQKLAGYIFGDNKAKEKISMTSPVHMDINDTASKMSFVMPSSYTLESLPKPIDPTVLISESASEYVAVIKFSGFASDKDINYYSKKLQTLLLQNNITSFGNYRFYGYNPPYQLVNRRNEIVVGVKWK